MYVNSESLLKNQLLLRERPKDQVSIMHQKWRDLLFLHWKWEVSEIQKKLPKGLYVDTFKGEAYISVLPFFIKDVHLNFCPSLPFLTNFVEINVRTYVYDTNGIPGIWFFSLDINSFMASRFARILYYLPYFSMKMNFIKEKTRIKIEGNRKDYPKVSTQFDYQPFWEESHQAEIDSLDFFLIERYLLFTYHAQKLYKGRVHHAPYPLKGVKVLSWDSKLLEINEFKNVHPPDHIHYSSGVDVDIFSLKTRLAPYILAKTVRNS